MTERLSNAAPATGVLPLGACDLLCDDLARAESLGVALDLLNQARALALGPGMLTVNRNATPAGGSSDDLRLQRLWSSEPAAYPVGGAKRKTRTAWTVQLFEEARTFVGEGDAALAAVFDDHATILSLGLHAVVNVPILQSGRCVATFNVLSSRTAWQAHEVATARLLALLATPHVLAAL